MKEPQTLKLYFTMLLSLIVLLFALGVVSLGAGTAAQNWAFGIVGSILGYWFKGGRS